MKNIRKQGLLTTSWIYFGFIIGALNTYLFAKKGFFTITDYGLATTLNQIGQLLTSVSALGCFGLLLKFYPYYNIRLAKKDNELLSLTLGITLVGFIVVAILGVFAQPLIVKKFIANAPALVHYFYYAYIIAFGYLLYSIFEYQGWNLQLQLFTNILREVVVRVYILVCIILKLLTVISFHQFLMCYSFQYLFIAGLMMYKLYTIRELVLVFKISRVTQKLKKIMLKYLSYGFIGTVVGTLKMVIDILVLSSFSGLKAAGVYTFASFIATILQAPYRSLVSITLPILALAWKEKNFAEIDRIYKRSSINLLLFSTVLFGFIWINFEPFIHIFQVNTDYLMGKNVLVLLCLTGIIEMGTGVNGQIIGTSTLWRFEFFTNIILAVIITTCTYFFTKYVFGINGPAVAILLGTLVYNSIRIIFLYQKFKFLPFTTKTILSIIILAPIIILSKLAIQFLPLYAGLIFANFFMLSGFAFSIIKANLSPDVKPVVNNLLKKFGFHFTIR